MTKKSLLVVLLALGVVLAAAWVVYAANLPPCTSLCSRANCDSFCTSRGFTCVGTEVGCMDQQPYCHYFCQTPHDIRIYDPGPCTGDFCNPPPTPGGSPVFKKQPTNP